MYIGAHVTTAGGLGNAVKKGNEIGAEILQIFVSSPQSFRTFNRSDDEIVMFKKMYQSSRFRGLFFHGIYLINLASSNARLVNLSKDSLTYYLKMGDKLGAEGTVVHLGSYGYKVNTDIGITDSERVVLDKVAANIIEILKATPKSQGLIIENAAGRSKIGGSLDDLVYLRQKVNSVRLKFCLDTQHLFASGVDVSDYEFFEEYLIEFDRRIGIDKLAVIHANDSKTELGSEHDRHENIGEGKIGRDGFTNILRQSLLQEKPIIIETPGFDNNGPDRENLDRLKKLYANK